MARDTWDPDQYERFRAERSRPFYDLLERVQPKKGMRAVDLGCGTGELTRDLHRKLGCAETIGIDSSDAMLGKAKTFAEPGLHFEKGDLATFAPEKPFDLVFSNAAIHWVSDQAALLTRLRDAVAPGGQLAIQMPANFDHPSHVLAAEVAREPEFAAALGGYVRPADTVLAPEAYAQLLHDLGFEEQRVTLEVYGHVLGSRDEVVEWVKGTLLTDYEKRLEPALFERYLGRYREVLLPRLSPAKPFFYPFKRILFDARRSSHMGAAPPNPALEFSPR